MPSKLTFLRVHRFRRVRPGTFIEFGSQLNTVIGRNGTGKTTLLALVSAIVRNNVHQFIHEDFEFEFGLADGDVTFEGTLSNKVGEHASNDRSARLLSGVLRRKDLAVHIESDANESRFTYRGRDFTTPSIGPEHDPQRRASELIHNVRLYLPQDDPSLLALAQGAEGIALDIIRTHNYTSTRIHEGIETFEDLFAQDTDHHHRSPTLGVTFVQHPDLRKANIEASAAGHHLSDEVLIPQLAKQSSITDIVTIDGTAPPLAKFVELSQYTDARLILTKTSATTKDDVKRTVFAKPVARFTTTGGDQLVHPHLSFGEKRLLAFLIKIFAYKHTIIVDELANGMHHAWLGHAVGLLEDNETQAFLTGQNPLLFDCLPLGRDTYGREHHLVVCELSDSGEMIWRNLSDIECDNILESLDVGFQHVSSVMRTMGLW